MCRGLLCEQDCRASVGLNIVGAHDARREIRLLPDEVDGCRATSGKSLPAKILDALRDRGSLKRAIECGSQSIARGVPRGTNMPFHSYDSAPATPDSAIVGTSGSAASRVGLATATARNRPDLMLAIDDAAFAKKTGTWPPMTAVIACAPPLKGTWFILIPACCMNRTAAKFCAEPLPVDA